MSYLDKETIQIELDELKLLQDEAKASNTRYLDKKKKLQDKGFKFDTEVIWNCWIKSAAYEENVSVEF